MNKPFVNKKRTILLLTVIVALLAFFVWPTPYTYPLNRNHSVRLNRFTQRWEKFDQHRQYWRLAGPHDFIGEF